MAYAQINGMRVSYRLEGEGPLLVLLHGGQGDASSFDSIIPPLAARYSVLSFDQRGSGATDKPQGPYSMELLADDAIELLTFLGLPTAVFFGISMGGMIAQEIALRHPKIHVP